MAAGAALPERVARKLRDVAVRVDVELEAVRIVRIVRRRARAVPDVLGGDELPVVPAAFAQQQIAEPQHVRRPHGDAAAARRVRRRRVAFLYA